MARKKGTIVPKKGTIVHFTSPTGGAGVDYGLQLRGGFDF